MEDSIVHLLIASTVVGIVFTPFVASKFHSQAIVNECTRLITEEFGNQVDRVPGDKIFCALARKISIKGETLTLRKHMVGITLIDMLKHKKVALHYPGITREPIQSLADLGDRETEHRLVSKLRSGELDCCIRFSL